MYFISLLFLTVVNTVYRLKSSESKAAESENVEPNAKAQDLDGLRMEKEAALDKLKESESSIQHLTAQASSCQCAE